MYDTITIPLGRAAVYGTLDVDTTRFPPNVQRYIYEYGLRQVLNDAMAEKKDEDGNTLPHNEIVAKAEKRLQALYAGTLRTPATPADPVEAELYKLVMDTITRTLRTAGYLANVPKGTRDRALWAMNQYREKRRLTPFEDNAAMVANHLERSPDAAKLRKQAERNVAERQAAVEAVDLDALFGTEEGA